MQTYDLFDIIGPRMVGPSSSHTAGAARLGRMANKIAGGHVKRAHITLFGSFATTGRGHGTDKAIVAGILGMEPTTSGSDIQCCLPRRRMWRFPLISARKCGIIPTPPK